MKLGFYRTNNKCNLSVIGSEVKYRLKEGEDFKVTSFCDEEKLGFGTFANTSGWFHLDWLQKNAAYTKEM